MTEITHPKVAITQMSIIPGGRLRVIIGIVKLFNQMGITPHILTTRFDLTAEQLVQKYGHSLQVKIRFLPRIPKLTGEFRRVLFNAMLNWYASDYDLLVNSSNSLIFLPKHKKVVSYVHFPRKRRIMDAAHSIHLPDANYHHRSGDDMRRAVLRFIYRFSKPQPHHLIVCNSEFTMKSLQEVYTLPETPQVVYPPVETARFLPDGTRIRIPAVVSVGRFSSSKRQLEQIQLAEQMPQIPFHIVGFAGNNPYYQQCSQYVKKRRLKNVHLHPDAPFDEMLSLLHGSRYFLHTLINEPFGITAVQAVAAGCLPIVHNSGGQREVVPDSALRYDSLSQVPAILNKLEGMSDAGRLALAKRLQEHAANFDDAVFVQRMQVILNDYLGTRSKETIL